MQRPKPTAPLLIELSGNNNGLISSLHHGLRETPLQEFYPVLDLDELVAFAASSWKGREQRYSQLTRLLSSHAEAYEMFSEVYRIGFPWLNKYKDISPANRVKHERLNPFQGKFLQDRLTQVDPSAVEQLREKLAEPVSEYVFECNYYQRKKERDGDNYKLEVMTFQTVYPRREKIVPLYAQEIARMLKKYSTNY